MGGGGGGVAEEKAGTSQGGPSAAERGARARGARARRTLSDRERTPFAIQDDEALSPHLAEAGRVSV